jgi:predicted nucleotidyltransferase
MKESILKHPYINLVLDYVRENYADDIDVITLYGSFLRRDYRKDSDIDLFFVPANQRGYSAGFTVIIDEIGYDFFPISWERLEKITLLEDSLSSLITSGDVLYYKDQAALSKYLMLKENCLNLKDFSRVIEMKISKTKEFYFDFPNHLPDLLGNLIEIVSLKNNRPIQKGIYCFESELKGLSTPKNFIDKTKRMIDNPDLATLKVLINEVIDFVQDKENLSSPLESGFYEELKSIYLKALNNQDIYQRYFIKAIIDRETISQFGLENDFPFLEVDYDLWLKKHEAKLLEKLAEANVKVSKYSSFDEFRKDLMQR